jgi:putative flippase GtrA
MKTLDVIQKTLLASEDIGAGHRLVRHLFAGGLGTVGYMVFVVLLVEFAGAHPVVGVVIAFLFLEVYTYIVSRWWVYHATNAHIVAVPRFIVVIAISLALNAGIMYLAHDVFSWWYGFGLMLTLLILPATNFALNYFWTFREPQGKL